jgi:hypothetical protein
MVPRKNPRGQRILHKLQCLLHPFSVFHLLSPRPSVSPSTSPRQTTPHDFEQEKLWVSYNVNEAGIGLSAFFSIPKLI